MNTPRRAGITVVLAVCLLAPVLLFPGCAPQSPGAMPPPTYTIEQTSMDTLTIQDFDAFHSPVGGDDNEYLTFGSVKITPAAPGLSPDLASLLGRWEGYAYGPPVSKDWKFVLVVQEITALGGKAVLWTGTNLQYPEPPRTITFRVISGAQPTIEWGYIEDGGKMKASFSFDPDEAILRGWLDTPTGTWGPIKLNRDETFVVYKDYAKYLAGKGITAQEYQDEKLKGYGKGYLLYLPDGYDDQPEKTWPLITFLHGSGDRGDNLFLLPKASPFMMIREQGPLPFIIVAPLLSSSQEYATFPDKYLEGVVDEVLAAYRVDHHRIYLTGLSMGGEATYRFALHHPETFAAVAPLAGFNPKYAPGALAGGYKAFDLPLDRFKDVPVWAIQGEKDPIVSLSIAQNTANDIKEAGGDITFTVMKDHDHDVWTDTYSDPEFYAWLLEHEKP